jgi:hypothetical protein
VSEEEAMAVVKGIREELHYMLYDSVSIRPKEQLGKILTSNVLRFFVDVTGKTKLQTNMQASSVLPHWNTYEARAMRVVISDLAAQFPEKPIVDLPDVRVVDIECQPDPSSPAATPTTIRNLTLGNFVELKRRIEALHTRALLLSQGDISALSTATNSVSADPELPDGQFAELDRGKIDTLGRALVAEGAVLPPREQIFANGFGGVIGKFIYNTVTTLVVGEKEMFKGPTWFFPAGAGPYSEDGQVTTHGYPNPQATFHFATAVKVDAQQPIRVEIEAPDSDVLRELQTLYGPLFIWVVIDGYMMRDVQ